MSSWEYTFDLSMLVLFWIGVLSIIITIILRSRQNKRRHRTETGAMSASTDARRNRLNSPLDPESI